ncbi:UDP-N-acetylglucosamine:LPS N-acetylglucosamine transferase [Paraburkholderia sp. Clong3]
MTALPQRTVMVMAGGTGGHVFPGLAVAHLMQAWGWKVVWLGNPAGMEATLVPKHGIPMEYLRFGGVRGKGLKTKLMLPVNLLRACTQSLSVLRRVKPDVVLGMGGYITFPAGLMTALSGPAARAARTEFDRGSREQGAREAREARAGRISECAAAQRMDR